MPRKHEYALAAGLILGEGCLTIYRHHTNPKKNWNVYQPRIDIRMGDLGMVKWLTKTFGGTYYEHELAKYNRWHRMGNWVLIGKKSILPFCLRIRPYCLNSTEKLKQIDIMIKFCASKDRRSDRSKKLLHKQEKWAARIRALKPRNRSKK